jgi:hypothetical protein
MGGREDYVNPTMDKEMIWRSMKSYDTHSKDSMERWKYKMYEASR